MTSYLYLAKTSPDKTREGTIEAESVQDAVNKLAKIGHFPIYVKAQELALDKRSVAYFLRSPKKELVLFTRQLANLVESGVNILSSLNIAQAQTSGSHLKAILNDLVSKIKDGRSLSESMSLYPDFFSGLYISMVHSGEIGGNVDLALKRLADYLEKEEEFKDSVRAALIYPLFILVISILTVTVLLGFVVPRMVGMFADMGQVLPLPTKILISFSGFLRSFGWLVIVVILITLFLLRRVYRTARGKAAFDNIKLRIFLLGKITLKTEISRLTRTLSLLLCNGVAITQSLDISATVLENGILKLEVSRLKNDVVGGLSLSKSLKGSKFFPQFVTSLVSIGEETGTLERSLLRISDEYEKEVDRVLKTLTRLLEPVIILVMGCIVGFIVISMLLPIFQINLIVR